jgi:hypothetical protein
MIFFILILLGMALALLNQRADLADLREALDDIQTSLSVANSNLAEANRHYIALVEVLNELHQNGYVEVDDFSRDAETLPVVQ